MALAAARRLVLKSGYEHPLEAAHIELLSALTDLIEGAESTRRRVLAPYEGLGIGWSSEFVRRSAAAGRLAKSIPI